ncbi:sensor histidine kinase [Altererythrobacter xixiisoli]|uniref:histidine kinase n=2 Tax=Croceibacterium xixiisoli TaxID=1476466 RepID=A0A6I4TXB6_9SPHN|nr:sensor histidine kinase [Croceibacterium xixiisoli]
MSQLPPLPIPLAEADAGRRNMSLLIQLRWLAVGGQLLTIQITRNMMDIAPPLAPLLGAIALLVVINLLSLFLLYRGRAVTNIELTAALLFDVAALCWQLHHSGGLANPFASLFLLQVVIGTILLTPRSAWMIVAATLIAIAALRVDPTPLDLPPDYAANPMALYLMGSLVCFVLIAVLLVAFVSRISRNLRDRDAALAGVRQRAAEEDHIVRMGLLASGAAHELGTPMSTMSVILGDLARHPAIADDGELGADIADMQAELQRCKQIVGGILMSAGEVRGENPSITTVRRFVADMVTDWSDRTQGVIELRDDFGEDLAIVSDPALRQVIGNIIDNALEVSPSGLTIHSQRAGDDLLIDVLDDGPGFSAEMLAAFGRPYSSTKGKAGGGLGLFLVVNVIRKLGGKAEVTNRGTRGARVRVSVPLAALAYQREALA